MILILKMFVCVISSILLLYKTTEIKLLVFTNMLVTMMIMMIVAKW
jgi:hypothetical protein